MVHKLPKKRAGRGKKTAAKKPVDKAQKRRQKALDSKINATKELGVSFTQREINNSLRVLRQSLDKAESKAHRERLLKDMLSIDTPFESVTKSLARARAMNEPKIVQDLLERKIKHDLVIYSLMYKFNVDSLEKLRKVFK